jgi:hypothetical protein
MPRIIQGWNVAQKVLASDMQDLTCTQAVESQSAAMDNLPCIYNGLIPSQPGGTGSGVVNFTPGVARCQDLLTSTYTYLPVNPYAPGYPAYLDFSVADANLTITLDTVNASGYIVAAFTISPVTTGQIQYTITANLAEIPIASYNPALHVRLLAYTYATGVWTIDVTPNVSRDNDLTGLAGVQWDGQNNALALGIPQSQTGADIFVNQPIIMRSGNALTFNNSANTQSISFNCSSGQAYNFSASLMTFSSTPSKGMVFVYNAIPSFFGLQYLTANYVQGSNGAAPPPAGFIGQYIRGYTAVFTPPPSSWGAAETITLTAGSWDVSAVVVTNSPATSLDVHIGLTTSSTPTPPLDAVTGDNYVSTTSVGYYLSLSIPAFRIMVTINTTCYLNVLSSSQISGRISATLVG